MWAAIAVLPLITAARNFTSFVSKALVVNALRALEWSVTIWLLYSLSKSARDRLNLPLSIYLFRDRHEWSWLSTILNFVAGLAVAGLTAARARGRTGGRPPKLPPKEVKAIHAMLKSTEIPVAEIPARFHIARSTLYRAILNPAA